MTIDQNFVTKKYFTSRLNPLKKELINLNQKFSSLDLKVETLYTKIAEINTRIIKLEVDIVSELRSEIHQSVQLYSENMKAHQEREIKRYIGIVMENFREDNKSYWDGVKANTEKIQEHGIRLQNADL